MFVMQKIRIEMTAIVIALALAGVEGVVAVVVIRG